MPMLKEPSQKYDFFHGPNLPERMWPSKTIKQAPRWLATDLRDGNQSLASPMTIDQKWKYFNMLVNLGFKEIEISIPSASEIEFDFTRQLIETPEAVPDDVWLQVLCPCRLDLILQTVRSLKGAKKVVLSLYHASSPTFLETVFGMSKQEVHDKVVEAIRYAKSITKDDPSQQGNTVWNLMFSPEAFSDTDLAYSLQLCETAKSIWQPTVDVPIILNLPATVEMSTPNVYADQVEIFSKSISEREKVCVSLHPHNDRGCAVAAAELGQMAGADRIEGCLFGHGERAGNVDLVILALNLYTQGINPGIELSDLPSIRTTVEECTSIKVHDRAPYGGNLVHTAYSGAHQDAINKGLTKIEITNGTIQPWKVPYLAIDPQDIGLNYEAVIRLNSQSGKGGVAWTLARELAVHLPKGLQFQFSKVVKRASQNAGGIIPPDDVTALFLKRYFISEPDPRILTANLEHLKRYSGEGSVFGGDIKGAPNRTKAGETEITRDKTSILRTVDIVFDVKGRKQQLRATGLDIIDAVKNAVAITWVGEIDLQLYEFDMNNSKGVTGTALAVECKSRNSVQSTWGARVLDDRDSAEFLAALSSVLDLLEQSASDENLTNGVQREVMVDTEVSG